MFHVPVNQTYLTRIYSSNSTLLLKKFEILSMLHPTPAVCGWPTEEARDFIAETGTRTLTERSMGE